MSNEQRNIEAMCIYRPVATGQVRPSRDNGRMPYVEAAINTIVRVVFGVDLLPPCNPAALWQGRRVV